MTSESAPSSVAPTPPGAKPLPAPGSLGAWVLAARPRTLVAAWAPVLAGSAWVGWAEPVRALGALIVALSIQVGTNFVNDAADHARGADTEDRLGPPRAVSSGLLPGRTVMKAGFATFALAGIVGVWLASVSTWWLLVPGGVALAAGIAYTAGPKPLAYLGLGEVFVFAFFGVFATVGTMVVQIIDAEWWSLVSPTALWLLVVWTPPMLLGAAFGLLAVAILEINNIRDAPTDELVGKRTLAVRLGDRKARVLYLACLWGSFVALGGACLREILVAPLFVVPVLLILLAALPSALRSTTLVRTGADGRALNAVLGHTAAIEAVFGGGLVAGLGFIQVMA